MGLDVVLLAGAKNNKELLKVSTEDYEALIKVNGIAMVDYVLDVLKDIDLIDNIIVVGPPKMNKDKVDKFIPCQESLLDNIKLGLSMSQSEYTLILTSDIPLISREEIIKFLAICKRKKADIYYPIINKETVEEYFSNANKTYFSLKDGSFTGGNIFLVNKKVLYSLEELLAKIIKLRKKPWRLVNLLGFKFIFKLLTANLSIDIIEKEFRESTGYIGKILVLEGVGVGFDIDNLSQLRDVEEYLQSSDMRHNILFNKN